MNELTEQNKNEMLEVLGAKSLTIKKWDEIVTADTITYPLADLSSLGTAFSGLSTALSAISQATKAGGTLYEATFPVEGHLAVAKDGSGLLGTIVQDGEGIVGQARFKEVGQVAKTAGGLSTIFMAMAIMAINKSLKNIAENQKDILCFLEIDKQTQLKCDLLTLSDIIEEYQHNWNNTQYLSNREIQVLDIKRSAEQNILFYREMIDKKLGKQQFIRLDSSKVLNEVQSKFKYYQLALYIYSFTSFLDVMLLKNFDEQYLSSVSQKVKQYSLDYSEFYEKSLKGIEAMLGTSVQSRALQGLSIAGKFIGKQIEKIPDKENKIRVDDKLISGSEKLNQIQAKTVEDTKESFKVVEDSGISMFVDKINLINTLYNKQLRIAVSDDCLYLNTEKA